MKLLLTFFSLLPAAVFAKGLSSVNIGTIADAATDCTEFTHIIQVRDDISMLYLLTETKLSVRLEIATDNWIAVGIAPNSDGAMVGSDAIIGLPLESVSSTNPGKYYMIGETESNVFLRESSSQTITNGDVWQQNGSTYMAFTKALDEVGEIPITTSGVNYFLWAYGLSPELGVHNTKDGMGAFAVDAASTLCIPSEGSATTNQANTATTIPDDQTEDEDEDDRKENTTVPTDNSTSVFTCDDYQHKLQIANGIRMSYVVSETAMKVLLQYDGEAWLSLGLSPSGSMIGGEAVIGLPDESLVGEYNLNSEAKSGVVLMGTQTLTDVSIVQESGTTTMTFTKQVSESNKLTMAIDGTTPTTFIWAYGFSNELAFHKHDGSFQLTLKPCTENAGLIEETSIQSSKFSDDKVMAMWTAHAFLGLIAWGFLVPTAISASRLRDLLPAGMWYTIHFYSNVLVLVLTLIAFVLAMVLYDNEGKAHFSDETHEMVGLVIMVVVIVQALSGIFRPPKPHGKKQEISENEESSVADGSDDDKMETTKEQKDKEQSENKFNTRVVWEYSHKFVGVSLLAMGLWQVSSGIELYAHEFDTTDYTLWFWVYIGSFAAIVTILFIWNKTRTAVHG